MIASILMVRRLVGLLVLIGVLLGILIGSFCLTPLPAPPVAHAATFEVTNGNDSGNGSLRQAILDANANGEADTITFAPNVTTVTLTSGQLEISDDLTIDGGDGVTVERDGGAPDFRIFEISGIAPDVTLDGLTITNGNTANDGGGILNSGSAVTVTDSTISDNTATDGGGIYNRDGGTVTVTNSTLSGNSATNNGGGSGGGISNNSVGAVNVTDSTLSGNSATSGGGIRNAGGTVQVTDGSTLSGNSATNGVGGGIENTFGGTVTVTDSTITGNSATNNGGGISNFSGGEVAVTNSTLSDNSATTVGGGIFNDAGTVTVTDSEISGNSADVGGGIRNGGGTVTVTNSTLSSNTGVNNGGGISNGAGTVTVTNSTLSSNEAGSAGSGIRNFGGDVTVTNSTLSGNTGAITGGGISNGTGTVQVTNSTLSGNSATNGGGIAISGGTVTVTDSTLSSNEAGSDGGGIFNSNTGTVTVTNSTLSGNTVKGDGGGILNGDVGTVTVTNSTLSGNSATNGGGIRNAGGGRLTLANTIVANSPDGDDVDNTSILSAEGQNIISDTSISGANITNGTDPQLGPLQDNGGPTFTHLPGDSTPAIDAGVNAVALDPGGTPLTTDQRGLERIVDGTVDIGAVEVGAGDISYTISIAPTTVEEGDSGDTPTATVTVARTGGTTLASSVDLSLGGDATENTDYTFALAADSAGSFNSGTGTLSFAADETEATFTITVQGDDVVEPDETVEVTLTNPTAPEGATITPPDTVTLTITDDEEVVYLPIIRR